MDTTDTILTSGFRLGQLFKVSWKLNFLFPIVGLAAMWRMQDVWLGLLAIAVLLFSVVIHELAHLVASRTLGGEMDEIQLWPLGGLSHPYGRGYLVDHARVLLAGPLVNLGIAISCVTRLSSDQISSIVREFALDISPMSSTFQATVQFMFAANLLLFVVNLLPVVPFDAGILLRTYLADRFSEVESRDLMIRSGLVVGVFGLLCGFVFDMTTVVGVSAFLVILHTHDNMKWLEMLTDAEQAETGPLTTAAPSETFADDFPVDDVDDWSEFGPPLMPLQDLPAPANNSEQAIVNSHDEHLVDEILEKLHLNGRDSLSESEIELLEQVSDQIRQRRSSI